MSRLPGELGHASCRFGENGCDQLQRKRIAVAEPSGVLAPENTLAGLREAKQRGYVAVEFDVMLARDDATRAPSR